MEASQAFKACGLELMESGTILRAERRCSKPVKAFTATSVSYTAAPLPFGAATKGSMVLTAMSGVIISVLPDWAA